MNKREYIEKKGKQKRFGERKKEIYNLQRIAETNEGKRENKNKKESE